MVRDNLGLVGIAEVEGSECVSSWAPEHMIVVKRSSESSLVKSGTELLVKRCLHSLTNGQRSLRAWMHQIRSWSLKTPYFDVLYRFAGVRLQLSHRYG